jgi:hypothetical protein
MRPLPASPTATTLSALVRYPLPRDGRWLVCHDVPGTSVVGVDADCLTLSSALEECARLNGHRAPKVLEDA